MLINGVEVRRDTDVGSELLEESASTEVRSDFEI